MRETKRFERRITTPYFKVGTLKEAVGKGEVVLESSANVPFEYLVIEGATSQELPNRLAGYSETVKNASSYSPAGFDGIYVLPLPSELVGKEITYQLKKTGELGGVVLSLSDGASFLFSELTPLCSQDGEVYTVKGDTFTHLMFTNVYTSDKESEDGVVNEVRDGIIDFWNVCDLVATAEISPDFEAPVSCVGDKGVLLTLNFNGAVEKINIPSTLSYEGKTVPFIFSEYDELEISVRKKRVIYRDGTVHFNLTGEEEWQLYTEFASEGGGALALYEAPTPFSEGYCTHLNFVQWPPESSQKNVFSVFGISALAIKLEGDEADDGDYEAALEKITALLKEKHKAGAGVEIMAKRREKIEYDISKTELGLSLLSIFTPYDTDGKISAAGFELMPTVKLGYYSLNDEKSAFLTVLCQDEGGEELERITHTLRKGSAYHLKAPEIDGYTPKTSELWGAIKDDKTIILEYKEK